MIKQHFIVILLHCVLLWHLVTTNSLTPWKSCWTRPALGWEAKELIWSPEPASCSPFTLHLTKMLLLSRPYWEAHKLVFVNRGWINSHLPTYCLYTGLCDWSCFLLKDFLEMLGLWNSCLSFYSPVRFLVPRWHSLLLPQRSWRGDTH